MDICYEIMRNEYGMDDYEYWRETSLARLTKMLQLRNRRMGLGEQTQAERDAEAAVAAGL